MTNKPNPADNPWRAAALVGVLGIDLALCVLLGYFGGAYISNRTGGQKFWVIVGLLTGLLAGIVSGILLIKRFLEDTNE